MADDLIPPPSPAGKPDPEATRREDFRVNQPGPGSLLHDPRDEPRDAVPPAATSSEDLPPLEPGRVSLHRSRFGLLTGALAGIAIGAIVITALILFGGGGGGGARGGADGWAEWTPTASDRFSKAAQIAQHVGRKYRLEDDSQMVGVESGPLLLRDLPVTVVVKTAATGGDIVPIGGEGIEYTLYGLGEGGSIKGGKASPQRLSLLKREALELALFSFRYIENVDHVVVLLPPPPPDAAGAAAATTGTSLPETNALLFRPGDVEAEVRAPLAVTVPPQTPNPANFAAKDVDFVNQLTAPNFFLAAFRQTPDTRVLLVLERHPATIAAPSASATATATATPTATSTAKKGSQKEKSSSTP